MPSTRRHWLDNVYLVYFVLHIPILFCVDLVPFYPPSLWSTPTSPLSFLGDLRSYYLSTYKDQFFAPPPAPIPSFFPLFAFWELVFHLPVAVWAVGALWGNKEGRGQGGLKGKDELLLLVYGVETALTTATCMWEAWLWDETLIGLGEKAVLLGGLYGGYLAVAVLLTGDMYMRLLNRVEAVDERRKLQ
ncbi:transmembrane protein 6/97 [Pseudomassariella vexata]|uniref:Efficient mitochondria targeting-associated protein 19 n=1 Tax=Pseudomassariella vexata TaxID=1141098 RepID=A0A1Y2DFW6_9PEZI|nr:transmembrane protein 6/97 [Pseudomassariella vexata]ORY58193.1 transmembrane protein 6/97 [Pseudomassariella vexata]